MGVNIDGVGCRWNHFFGIYHFDVYLLIYLYFFLVNCKKLGEAQFLKLLKNQWLFFQTLN